MGDKMENGAAETDLGSATPNVIRAACRARFYKGLDILADIANDSDQKAADRVRALDTLGRFGLGAADQGQVHIHAGDGATVIGVVRLPVLGETIAVEIPENGGNAHASGAAGDASRVPPGDGPDGHELRLIGSGPGPDAP
jgi:hypothetical protein